MASSSDAGSTPPPLDIVIHWAQRGSHELIEDHYKTTKPTPTVQVDSMGNTALHFAAGSGHAETVALLLRLGFNPNQQNRTGDTALHKAAWRNQVECIKLLVAARADLEKKNHEGKAPFELAKKAEAKSLLLPAPEFEEDEDSDAD